MSSAGRWLILLSRSSINAVDGEGGGTKMEKISEEVVSRSLIQSAAVA